MSFPLISIRNVSCGKITFYTCYNSAYIWRLGYIIKSLWRWGRGDLKRMKCHKYNLRITVLAYETWLYLYGISLKLHGFDFMREFHKKIKLRLRRLLRSARKKYRRYSLIRTGLLKTALCAAAKRYNFL